ncbi:MAG: hypothetical protein JXJ17_14655 [Anaerolineae bacterium]|nr:hypothetical protein [Anaerolineae bacterium]
MEDTYTFTARSEIDPAHVATFTLHNRTLSVGIGPALEHIERFVEAGEDDADASISPILKPATVRVMQYAGQEFDINDVEVQTSEDDNDLSVRLWTRAGGLRLAPVIFKWEAVDNPKAASAFADEIDRRKKSTPHPGRFAGLPDYWATWLIGGLLLILLIGSQRRDKVESTA